ncbi:MAG: hypothetical protein H8F28_24300 [Fibrella sp.]|nr:hypothetical protein [Armatimonadota bacterium]
MGIIDTLLGRNEPQAAPAPPPVVQPTINANARGTANANPPSSDAQAVARYRYMLQTAPPETLEQAHTEAFARLTPEQRRLALQQLANVVPEDERAALQDDPQSMARAATRAEVRQPGVLERTFGGGGMGMGGGMMGGGGMGMGGLLAGGLLTSIAGSFIGSSIAHSFFDQPDVTNNFYESNPDMAGNSAENMSADSDGAYASNDGTGAGYVEADTPHADAGTGQGFETSDLGGGDADFGGGDFGGDFGGDV